MLNSLLTLLNKSQMYTRRTNSRGHVPGLELQVAAQEQDRIAAAAKNPALVDRRRAKALEDLLAGQDQSRSRTSEVVGPRDRTCKKVYTYGYIL